VEHPKGKGDAIEVTAALVSPLPARTYTGHRSPLQKQYVQNLQNLRAPSFYTGGLSVDHKQQETRRRPTSVRSTALLGGAPTGLQRAFRLAVEESAGVRDTNASGGPGANPERETIRLEVEKAICTTGLSSFILDPIEGSCAHGGAGRLDRSPFPYLP